ncbi:winged helix-turn-helix domain-containing protein [Halorussus caseinilyticus]|uniref:Winged helix-turn-helix domain-containing protein n=1 Tax=Halorussus caseinilyticus TaxID=3034025 RepID=A0ABD5WQ93_9EURY|nr:winged helix-turn-helix domain-containing protein [Halorussus sp. DT72]
MSANSNCKPSEEEEPYADGAALTELLGDGPKVKILTAFLADPEWDHNITEIAEMAGVSRNTVYRHIEDLTDLGVVKQTRERGGSKQYKINKNNAAAKKLAELEWELIDIAFDN